MIIKQQERINLILALHNHQPEGNLPEVFEQSFASAYEPFIRELESFPEVKVVLHYSGILLRWLQANRPEFMSRLRVLVSRGQVEMMGGAFYEPILPMIPDEDKIGQIKKQSAFIRENFQVEATGAWLAERVWEPHLAMPLARAGISYTVLDDAHFHNVGFSKTDTLHYYLTEEEGERLYVFPISEKLRYLIPFADPAETIDYLRQKATTDGERVVVLADDGEKFGSWPGTADLVYEKGWLRHFFSLLRENKDWLNVISFREHIENVPAKGHVYLPAGSYREMMEWSGGFWRNFFIRYPESNQIHKKMLHVREKLSRLPEGPRKQEAQEYLWAGQCNCAYWHGVFGGLYLNFLRSALYSRLIAAEELIDRVRHPESDWVEVERADYNYDGKEELLVKGPDLGFVLSPASGGALLELDFKPRRFNLLDVLTRRPEPYHRKLTELAAKGPCDDEDTKTIHDITRVKESGLEHLLVYDNYRRVSLLDHFFTDEALLEDFAQSDASIEAGDFIGSHYNVDEVIVNGKAKVVMSRNGQVSRRGEASEISLTKSVEYEPQGGKIVYHYTIINKSPRPLISTFGIEFNLNFLAGNAPDRYYTVSDRKLTDKHLDSRGEIRQVRQIGLMDEWQGIATRFTFSQPADIWRFPLETVSQSEEGMERIYQGSCIIPRWNLKLNTNESWTVSLTQRVLELGRDANNGA